MAFPGGLARAVIRVEAGAAKPLAARPALLRQKVAADAIDDGTQSRLPLPCVDRQARWIGEPPDVIREQGKLGIENRAVPEKGLQPSAHAGQQVAEALDRRPAD